jgi:hypothetical protein
MHNSISFAKKSGELYMFRVLIVLAPFFTANIAIAADLNRADAKKLLGFMGCSNASIGILINGFAPAGFTGATGPSVAFVSAICDRNGKDVGQEYTLLYDSDLGWIYYEPKKEEGVIQRWTMNGFATVIGPNKSKEIQQRQQQQPPQPTPPK